MAFKVTREEKDHFVCSGAKGEFRVSKKGLAPERVASFQALCKGGVVKPAPRKMAEGGLVPYEPAPLIEDRPPEAPGDDVGALEAGALAAANSLTFGTLPALAGAGAAALGGDYDSTRQALYDRLQRAQDASPVASFAGDMLGGVVSGLLVPGGAAAQGARAVTWGQRLVRGAKVGGAFGAAFGAGSAVSAGGELGDVAKGALVAGALGAATGGTLDGTFDHIAARVADIPTVRMALMSGDQKAVYQAFTAQALAAGVSPKEAAANAQLYSHALVQFAKSNGEGLSALDVWKQNPVEIRRQVVDADGTLLHGGGVGGGEARSALPALPGDLPPSAAPPPTDLHTAAVETSAPIRRDGTVNAGEVTAHLSQTRDWQDWFDRFAKNKRVRQLYTADELVEFRQGLENTAAIFGDFSLVPKEVPGSPIRDNSDPLFGQTFDITTICPRQDLYLGTVLNLERSMKRLLNPQERHLVGVMLREEGLKPACWYCYGQSGRNNFDFAIGKMATIARDYSAAAAAGKKGKALDEAFYGTLGDAASAGGEWKYDWDPKTKFRTFLDKNWKALKGVDLTDEVRLRDLARGYTQPKNAGEALFAAQARETAQSATKANSPKGFSPLFDQFLRMPDKTIAKYNASAGVRVNSQTDFRPWHTLEIAEGLAQLRAKGGMAHVYTKEADFLRIFGDTGIKFNLSASYATGPDGRILRDAKGRAMFDDVRGMAGADIEAFRKRYKNAGGMLVALNDEQLLTGLADPRLDMMIPYHAGSVAPRTDAFERARDYSTWQHEHWDEKLWGKAADKKKAPVRTFKLSNGHEVTLKGHAPITRAHHFNDLATYLELAEKAGFTPRFANIPSAEDPSRILPVLQWNGKAATAKAHPAYMKLVRDVARDPSNQDVVDPRKIDWKAASAVIDGWVQKGGDGGLDVKGDPIVTAKILGRIQRNDWPKVDVQPNGGVVQIGKTQYAKGTHLEGAVADLDGVTAVRLKQGAREGDFLYHVTPRENADAILREGLRPDAPKLNQGGPHDQTRAVFLTDAAGVETYRDLYGGDVEVFRVPRSRVQGIEEDLHSEGNAWFTRARIPPDALERAPVQGTVGDRLRLKQVLHRGVPAKPGEPSNVARFGPAYYYADEPSVAARFAEYRGEGSRVESPDIDLDGLTMFDARGGTDRATPQFKRLAANLAEELDVPQEQMERRLLAKPGPSGRSQLLYIAEDLARPAKQELILAREEMRLRRVQDMQEGREPLRINEDERDPRLSERSRRAFQNKPGLWPGQDRFAALAREAGYDGIIIDNPGGYDDVPGHVEYAFFKPPPERVASRLKQAAWHGSPHENIERFSLQKIGTGEGAQVYGHGLYFAQNPEVADYYRRGLQKGARVFLDGKEIEFDRSVDGLFNAKGDTPEQKIARRLAANASYLDRANASFAGWKLDPQQIVANVRRELRDAYTQNRNGARDEWHALGQHLDAIADRIDVKRGGATYKVDVPENDRLLDWDAPLSQQPRAVQDALVAAGVKDILKQRVLDSGRRGAPQKMIERAVENDWQRMKAGDFYDQLGLALAKQKKRGYGEDLKANAREASEWLQKAGIPGLRYLDQGSRTPGASTSHNFVVWDENEIRLLEKLRQQRGGGAAAPASERGYLEFAVPGSSQDPVRFDLALLDGADASTLAHESFHALSVVMHQMANRPGASPKLRADYDELLKVMGYASPAERFRLSPQEVEVREERAARLWEQYLASGKAPTARLAGPFTRFGAWMREIQSGLDDPQARAAFDRMLGGASSGATRAAAAAGNVVGNVGANIMGSAQPKVIAEDEQSFTLEQGGRRTRIAKRGLSEGRLAQIRGFAGGGIVPGFDGLEQDIIPSITGNPEVDSILAASTARAGAPAALPAMDDFLRNEYAQPPTLTGDPATDAAIAHAPPEPFPALQPEIDPLAGDAAVAQALRAPPPPAAPRAPAPAPAGAQAAVAAPAPAAAPIGLDLPPMGSFMPPAPPPLTGVPGVGTAQTQHELGSANAAAEAAIRQQAEVAQREAQALLDTQQQVQQQKLAFQQEWSGKLQAWSTRGEQLKQEFADGKLDPNHFWATRSTGQKMAGVIGLILSGLGSGLSRQPNMAMQVIDGAIARDLEAQKAELGKKDSLLRFHLQEGNDLRAAQQLARADMLDAAAGQITMVAARFAGDKERALADQKIAALAREAALARHSVAVQGLQAQAAAYDVAVKAALLPAQIQMAGAQVAQANMALQQQQVQQAALQQLQTGKLDQRLEAFLPEKIRDEIVRMPGGNGQDIVVRAKGLEEAKQARSQIAGLQKVRAAVADMRRTYEENGGWAIGPASRAKANAQRQMLVGALRVAVTGPGTMSDSDKEMLYSVIPMPGEIFSTKGAFEERLKQIEQKANDEVWSSLSALSGQNLPRYVVRAPGAR